jgi:hypothetical protein
MKISFKYAVFIGCMVKNISLQAQTYVVKKIPAGIMQITGDGTNAVWNKAKVLTNFSYPWETDAAPPTSFAALWDDNWLYCLFKVKDDSINTLITKNKKLEVGASDRVEIFLTPDSTMTPYYCLEIDSRGRVLDYMAWYYRKMGYNWQWPVDQLIIKTAVQKDGYIVEVAVGISSLKKLELLKNNRLHAGLFRAECKSLVNGKADLRWISWINPRSAKPDFHIPSAFGTLVLE